MDIIYEKYFRNMIFSKELFCKHEHCNLSTSWQFKENTSKSTNTHVHKHTQNIRKHTDTTHIHIDLYTYIDICIHI